MRTAGQLAGSFSRVGLVVLVVLVGCGSETGAPQDGPTDETELAIRVTDGHQERSWSLTCDPAGGDHPDPEAACRSLADLQDPFAPLSDDQACTDIYGGPQRARVTGTYRGRQVQARFDRTNGCQISRWDAHAEVLVTGPRE